jgi:hypothetical protein
VNPTVAAPVIGLTELKENNFNHGIAAWFSAIIESPYLPSPSTLGGIVRQTCGGPRINCVKDGPNRKVVVIL